VPVEIPVKTLARYCNPFRNSPWGGSKITKQIVQSAISCGELAETSFDPQCRQGNQFDAKYHAQRVAYFAVHGWSDPISIDVGVPSLGCHVSWLVDDGNHRLAAALFLKKKTIAASVSGEVRYAFDLFGVDVSDPDLPTFI